MPSFETGVRLLKNILIKKRSYSAFFADEIDALHKAFPAKATVHAGPFGIPMLWNSARNFLEKKSFEPRQTEGIAYVHIPFYESRCLFCMFYQNPYSSEAADAYANTLIKESLSFGINELPKTLPRLRLYISEGGHQQL
jgi:hypothetical protein